MDKKRAFSFEKTVNYTISTVDYMGLVVWSFVSKCGDSVKKATYCVLGVAIPADRNACKKSLVKKINKRGKDKQKNVKTYLALKKTNRASLISDAVTEAENRNRLKISEIEVSILELEKRLLSLEKQGSKLSESSIGKSGEKKEINEEKRAVLRMLVNEQKKLKQLIKQSNL
ncbi:MAG: hypothetical protein HQK64_00160 [Desulfamplus sp.]|nr:hypothetical protein [Desulfamplus sp.]MBF0240874.1 hypothetical protein [Desulfamplus sp.]MBF0388969.1 hypothetical protein [Desulfamplus sp.]